MEGGVTVILTLLILFGAIVGGVALFGAGGWVRRKEMKGELDEDGDGARPEHHVVENDTRDTQVPRDPSTSPTPPE